jgi:sigma-B regulation protein RsbU (phosphoserine phosphatase)
MNVGGDFYDVLETGEDELYFVIGDVSGKGVPAALLMAQALSMLRLIIEPGIKPERALARWNEMLSGHTVRGMFVTALLGRAVVSERRLELVNAGHCSPFRITAEGHAEEIKLLGAPPLGILAELPHFRHDMTLQREEWLTLFTDGLIESFDPDDVPLDRSGVAALLDRRFARAGDVIQALSDGELKHRREAEPHDDLTMLVFGFR